MRIDAMRHAITGLALVAALGAAPAIAKDKKAKQTTEQSGAASQENANREMNPDGTFQGKPVVECPADWKSAAAPDSGSSGASSGEAGSDMSGEEIK